MKLSEPVYNEKYLKAKIKSYNGKTKTNFPNNKIIKEGSQCIFLICNSDRLFLEQVKIIVLKRY